jgi:tRNA-dihydrouridine synthase B
MANPIVMKMEATYRIRVAKCWSGLGDRSDISINFAKVVKIGDIELVEFPLLLAPMEDVSDPPFRRVCKEQGADVMYTEFISSEGLIRDALKSTEKLDIFEYERPVGIQIFGSDIDVMMEAAEIATQAEPDIIDINYGCPVKAVACKGAGAALLQDVPKMVKMTEQIVKSTHLPVTVKTRLGWDNKTKFIKEVAYRLQDIGIQGLSIHGRTRVQMYKGEADWTLIGEIAQDPNIEIPIFGNGDVDSPEKAKLMKDTYGVQGIMIGRASIGNPWIFRDIKHYFNTGEFLPKPTLKERVEVCIQHFEEGLKWKGERRGILEMRRHYANYFKGIPHFKDTRMELVKSEEIEEIKAILNSIEERFGAMELV